MAVNNKEQITTKQLSTWEIRANKLHTKLVHTREDRMRSAAKHLHYSIKIILGVCEGFTTEKIKHKFLSKLAE